MSSTIRSWWPDAASSISRPAPGLIGIAAAKSGAAHVIANDVDPLAVIAISLNADANGVAVEASGVDLLPPDSGFDPASVDVVLVGDVFYDHDLAGRAVAFLERCRVAGCLVLVGDPGRADLPIGRLTKISDQSMPVTPPLPECCGRRPRARRL